MLFDTIEFQQRNQVSIFSLQNCNCIRLSRLYSLAVSSSKYKKRSVMLGAPGRPSGGAAPEPALQPARIAQTNQHNDIIQPESV
jgi:hypothetical protein